MIINKMNNLICGYKFVWLIFPSSKLTIVNSSLIEWIQVLESKEIDCLLIFKPFYTDLTIAWTSDHRLVGNHFNHKR